MMRHMTATPLRQSPVSLQPAWPVRGFFPQTERELTIERIDGQVPRELLGAFYRIGPATLDVYGQPNRHWFDGDGMICGFYFTPGKVTFRNRFVATPWFERERAAQRRLFSAFATVAPTLRGHLRRPKNPANTNIIAHDGRLLALYEAGRPFAVEPQSLATRGEESFGGTLPSYATFSAHPHRDRHSGSLISVGLSFRIGARGPQPVAEVWEVATDGSARRGRTIPLRHADVIHSVGMTQSKIIVLLGPYGLDLKKVPGLLAGHHGLLDCTTWRASDPLTVYVADRTGSAPPEIYELPTAFMIHTVNAFAQDDALVVDAILHPDPGLIDSIRLPFREPTSRAGGLTRLHLRPQGRVDVEQVCPVAMEFPAILPARAGLVSRYAYAGKFERSDGTTAATSVLLKVDCTTGLTQECDLGAGCVFGEPVLVPRRQSSAQDDAWALSLGYDGRDHHSFLSIIGADSWTEVARLHLPFHVPMGLHATFVPSS